MATFVATIQGHEKRTVPIRISRNGRHHKTVRNASAATQFATAPAALAAAQAVPKIAARHGPDVNTKQSS